MFISSIEIWDRTVTGLAQSNALSLVLMTLYSATILLIGAWLMVGVFTNWSDGHLNDRDSMFYIARFLALLIFTMFFF